LPSIGGRAAGDPLAEFDRGRLDQIGLAWPLLKDAYRTREKRYGLRSADLNIMLDYAIEARDIAFAKELVARIGEDWAPFVWRDKNTFDANVAWVRAQP
jgi:hypothetical protein